MNEIVPYAQRLDDLREVLTKDQVLSQLQVAAARGIDAALVARILMSEVQKTPKLLECTRQSLFGAVITCLQLGLVPDSVSGQAYLVPFRNRKAGTVEVVLIPGYRGLVQLAWRSNQIASIAARVVHVQDKNSLDWGRTPQIEHIPTRYPTTPDDVIAAYAIIRVKGGGGEPEWLWRDEIDKFKAKALKKSPGGPWVTDYEAMAKKTALRRACKLAPSTRELQRAITLDDQADSGLPQQLDVADLGEPGDSEPDGGKDGG